MSMACCEARMCTSTCVARILTCELDLTSARINFGRNNKSRWWVWRQFFSCFCGDFNAMTLRTHTMQQQGDVRLTPQDQLTHDPNRPVLAADRPLHCERLYHIHTHRLMWLLVIKAKVVRTSSSFQRAKSLEKKEKNQWHSFSTAVGHRISTFFSLSFLGPSCRLAECVIEYRLLMQSIHLQLQLRFRFRYQRHFLSETWLPDLATDLLVISKQDQRDWH